MDRPLIILKAGSKLPSLAEFAGDYEDWILTGLGVEPGRARVVRAEEDAAWPRPEAIGAVVITGSSAMVTERAPWVAAGEAWLQEVTARSVPLLGICFGHQWLAQALGGEVGYNPLGVEVGTVELRLTEAARVDPLFAGLPGTLFAQATHRQTVLRLPAGAVLLATSALDHCQSFRWGERAWGIQFHPEFAPAFMPRYIEHYRNRLFGEGKSPAALQRAVAPTHAATGLLRRFARLAGVA